MEVFRAVWRVLRTDGTCWLNLGDCYFGDSPVRGSSGEAFSKTWDPSQTRSRGGNRRSAAQAGALKPKDLCGLPWRAALALQADGWWLRSDIIWCKNNPMPESVRDRPTRAHEYLFLLTKRDHYYYDQDAIREPHTSSPRDQARAHTTGRGRLAASRAVMGAPRQDNCGGLGFSPPGRNRRSWWQVNARPFKGAHFATFPPALVEPCLLAGTSASGCCGTCGAPFVRVVEKNKGREESRPKAQALARTGMSTNGTNGSTLSLSSGSRGWQENGSKRETTGWAPSCDCPPGDPVPCTVLDPFSGSGTVGEVALKHGRNALLIDLNPEYCAMAQQRMNGLQPALTLD